MEPELNVEYYEMIEGCDDWVLQAKFHSILDALLFREMSLKRGVKCLLKHNFLGEFKSNTYRFEKEMVHG